LNFLFSAAEHWYWSVL